MTPTLPALIPALEATWPAADRRHIGPFLVNAPDPGGNRVSAARLASVSDDLRSIDDIDAAEAAMAAQGRAPLFMVMGHQTGLDAALQDRGYLVRDHTDAMVVAAATLAAVPPSVTAFTIWPPLAIQREIWAAGGIDAGRIAVMERALHCMKTSLFGRIDDRPAGTAYVGLVDGIAMLHALEIAPSGRRKGLAAHMMRAAAQWAVENGATWLCVLVTRQNTGAQGLYASLGMRPVGTYAYREKKGDGAS